MDKRLWVEARSTRWQLALTITLGTLAGVIVVLQAWVIAQLIDGAFLRHATLHDLAMWLVGLAGVIFARTALSATHANVSGEMALRIKRALQRRVMNHISALGPTFTAGERSGELVMSVTDGIEALDDYFRAYLPGLFTAFLIPIIILLVVLPIDGLTFAMMLITAPLIPAFMILIGKAAGSLARSQYSEMSLLGAHFLDVMQGLPTLKLFNRSQHQVTTIGRITNQFRKATMKVLRVAFLSAFTLELLATLSVAVIAVEIGLRLLSGNISFERALFLLIIAPDFYQPLRNLAARFHSGIEGQAAAERLYAILDIAPPIVKGSAIVPDDLTIRFEAVSYAYRDRPALHGITLDIPLGTHLALVGASGSGKSTIVALLLRFIQPTAGKITIGGIDLQQLEVEVWRAHLAWTGQMPHVFSTSIEENIRMGNLAAAHDAVVTAATKAQAHAFIDTLPNSYATQCSERGANLSGGQAQRLCLARALLRDAPILLLDEPTAQLDTNTEAAITDMLYQMRDKTLVLIAHRLRTVREADQIIVLNNGHIVERGTHDDLMALHGVYHQMVEDNDEAD